MRKFLLLLLLLFSLIKTIPRISIIAYLNEDSGVECFEDFLFNMVSQSLFTESELIIINPHYSCEEKILKKYLKAYPNIYYIRLSQQNPVHEIINVGIQLAQSSYVTMINIHDRRTVLSLEYQIEFLDQHPQYDLIYGDYCITMILNDQWHDVSHYKKVTNHIGPMPVWRTSLHKKFGLFNESLWQLFLELGLNYFHLPGISGLSYQKESK